MLRLTAAFLLPLSFIAASPSLVSFGRQGNFLAQKPRGVPIFPSSPPSCPICAQNFSSINSCAQATPVLANVTNVIFNPGSFVDVIKCACTDTFQSAYPQCADCFIKTNQTELLNCNTQDLPGIIQGMRHICALGSTLNGNVSGDSTRSSSAAVAEPTSTSNNAVKSLTAERTRTLFSLLPVGFVAQGFLTLTLT